MTDDERIARLERRLERERRAREEAEHIAERGLRDLWLANQDLEERVRERTAELEASLVATRQASAAKESFLGDLGHDLATPLHAVLGHLELIDRDGLGPVDRDRLETACRNADELATLLRGLIDLAGAEGSSSPDELEPVDPGRWLDDLVESWTRRAAGSGQLVVPTCRAPGGEVTAPWRRLRAIADLLLDNAVVHAGPGPLRIEVEVETTGDGAATGVTCHVVDSGPGLDEVQLATVLEPFVRVGAEGGLGIGLARADRLAQAAGGEVAVTSDGPGVEAAVRLPVSPSTDR